MTLPLLARQGWTRVLAMAVLLFIAAPVIAAPARADWTPRPVLHADFPDPAVVAAGGELVAYSTGDRVPRAWSAREDGPWHRADFSLASLPKWATEGGVWAVDVARIKGEWLLYYAAPVSGIVQHGRCIGVARSTGGPRGRFVPLGTRPLVCPDYANTPRAVDALPRDPTLPRAGVIDPSVYVDGSGDAYLLYKTDRTPSTIRILPLSQDGTTARTGAVSQELIRSEGVVENPVIVAKPQGYVMFVSEGDYTKCTYRTIWYRSEHLLDWTAAEGGVLLDRNTRGLCGPGGADVVRVPGLPKERLFFHGWTCRNRPLPCSGKAKWDHRPQLHPKRSMYALTLNWPAGRPEIAGWVTPR